MHQRNVSMVNKADDKLIVIVTKATSKQTRLTNKMPASQPKINNLLEQKSGLTWIYEKMVVKILNPVHVEIKSQMHN